MRHPHIVKLYNSFEDSLNLYIVLEYCSNGNLYTYIRDKSVIGEDEAFIYFF